MSIKIKRILPLLFIILIALFLRLILLDRIPTGISDDELDYVINAKAIFLTGHDITQTWSPFSLTTPPLEYPKGELPYLIISPFIGPSDFSLFNARLPYVVFSILLIIILYLIGHNLFGEKQALTIGLVAAINPWSIYFGRTSFDAPLAVLFFILTFYILLITKGRKILIALPFMFLAFYTYIGTKLIFLPFILIILLFAWKQNKKYKIKYFILLFLSFLLVLFFLINSSKSMSRLSEISIFNSNQISQSVNAARKNSISSSLNNIFLNKTSIFTEDSINKFLGFYSTEFLFLHGDTRSTFSIWDHGMFYYLDFLFLMIGFYALYKKYKPVFWLTMGLLLITPLPSVLSTVGTSYPIRSALAFPFLIILIGIGIWYSVTSFRKYKKIFIVSLIFLYTISLSNFMYIYLFKNPVNNSEAFGFSGRVLSRYLDLSQSKGQKMIVITDDKSSIPTLFKQYLFYSNSYNRKTASKIASKINNNIYEAGNISFLNCPFDLPKDSTVITVRDEGCKSIDRKAKKLTIAQLSDGGEIYKIYNDSVCSNYKLNRYPQNIQLKNLDVEKLSRSEFCNKFITNFN